ncbi:hypothetical protein AMEX_G11560 [Astyanax mexicanus]|uniref:Uncharacterized protein n=2 Tax=Astyanax mexicanus TaxID=7994 RepID=A0A8T2LXT5_ASTMX|nr:hypothetical protein AMEX_G11560 [Astyanax mexicanus]
MTAGAGGVCFIVNTITLTSRCSRVKMTGSDTKTRLDSLLMEADRMWELTVRVWFLTPPSPTSLRVAFSVVKKRPRCLYSTKTSLATPAAQKEETTNQRDRQKLESERMIPESREVFEWKDLNPL